MPAGRGRLRTIIFQIWYADFHVYKITCVIFVIVMQTTKEREQYLGGYPLDPVVGQNITAPEDGAFLEEELDQL